MNHTCEYCDSYIFDPTRVDCPYCGTVRKMTFDDLMRKILDVIPDATLDEDNEGQIVIYTGLEEDAQGNIRQFEPPPDDDEGDDEQNHPYIGSPDDTQPFYNKPGE